MTASDTVTAPGDTRLRRRMPPLLVCVAALVLLVIVSWAVLGEWLAPHDPHAQNPLLNVQPPSFEHWFGTDQLGRDVFSRVVAGTGNAIIGPVCVALGAVVLGLFFGMIAGYHGRWTDSVIARTADIFYSLPALLIAIVVVGIVSGSYWVTVAVLIFLTFPGDVRIFRSVTLVETRLQYVDAARTLGVRPAGIIARHILPNIIPTVLATLMLEFATALVGFSALAFLGLGVDAGGLDWGTIIADGQRQLFVNPMMSVGTALVIIAVAASVTIVGDWLYDRFSRKAGR
ncbi:ABC transporter permease [Microbacterium sp. NPDC058342]|uniref:ABC transporter permease n=1 Tax=Microbacterium sp. NPDC058342 TaxID=3346454 RepID=UPI00364E3109